MSASMWSIVQLKDCSYSELANEVNGEWSEAVLQNEEGLEKRRPSESPCFSSRPLMCREIGERRIKDGLEWRRRMVLWGWCRVEVLRRFHFLPAWGFSPSKLAPAIESQWGEWGEQGSWGACEMGREISLDSFHHFSLPSFSFFHLPKHFFQHNTKVTS